MVDIDAIKNTNIPFKRKNLSRQQSQKVTLQTKGASMSHLKVRPYNILASWHIAQFLLQKTASSTSVCQKLHERDPVRKMPRRNGENEFAESAIAPHSNWHG